jgi:hypothetical protein
MSVSPTGVADSQCTEMGWGPADDDPRWAGGVGTATLMCVAAAYWGSVWLVSGLAPLAWFASHVAIRRRDQDQ